MYTLIFQIDYLKLMLDRQYYLNADDFEDALIEYHAVFFEMAMVLANESGYNLFEHKMQTAMDEMFEFEAKIARITPVAGNDDRILRIKLSQLDKQLRSVRF